MNGYFVTGTDTNVGKTVLSALLVAALDAIYWTPVQTGAVDGTDRESVRAWAEAPEERLPSERYRFDPPVSPHLASREAGVHIDLGAQFVAWSSSATKISKIAAQSSTMDALPSLAAFQPSNRSVGRRFWKSMRSISIMRNLHRP